MFNRVVANTTELRVHRLPLDQFINLGQVHSDHIDKFFTESAPSPLQHAVLVHFT